MSYSGAISSMVVVFGGLIGCVVVVGGNVISWRSSVVFTKLQLATWTWGMEFPDSTVYCRSFHLAFRLACDRST